MRFRFTTATEHAFEIAFDWRDRNDSNELDAVAALIGLLDEPECRAAVILTQHGIDLPAIQSQWPSLAKQERPSDATPERRVFSSELQDAFFIAAERLFFLPQPVELATEHILLGLAASDGALGEWLRRQGVQSDAIETEVRRLYGFERGEGRGTRDEGATVDSGQWAVDSEENRENADCSTDREAAGLAPRALESHGCMSNTQHNHSTHSTQTTTLRIIDATANRASEGLRVVEDFVRFVWDDRHLTSLCKQLRHDLTAALAKIPLAARLAARETEADVGTVLTTNAERCRENLEAVVRANFARLEESLRSLEEFGKIFAADAAEAFKQLRYRSYTLEKAVETTRRGMERLAAASLYVLIDGRASLDEFDRLAGMLIAAGVDVLQLRDKQLDDRRLLERARRLRELTAGTPTLFIVNDRPDIAALAAADGVHVGQEELSVKDARRIVGPDALVGVSTHSIEQARQAVIDGANYLGVGPTFPSDTKQFERFPGLELLHAVAAEIRLPAFAIGGITAGNAEEVFAAGFSRIAVSGAILSANDPAAAAKELAAKLKNATLLQ